MQYMHISSVNPSEKNQDLTLKMRGEGVANDTQKILPSSILGNHKNYDQISDSQSCSSI